MFVLLAALGLMVALGCPGTVDAQPSPPIPQPLPGRAVVQFVNESSVTVLLGVVGPTSVIPREGTWELPPGGWLTLDIPPAWDNTTRPGDQGPRFWARTGCRYDPSKGIAQCETGDGGDRYDCSAAGLAGRAPATLAEFCFNCGNNFNYWDVSVVDGANLSVNVEPLGPYSPDNPLSPGDNFWCRFPNVIAGADLRGSCPRDFQLKRSDLKGGRGNDQIDGGAGKNRSRGGAGADTCTNGCLEAGARVRVANALPSSPVCANGNTVTIFTPAMTPAQQTIQPGNYLDITGDFSTLPGLGIQVNNWYWTSISLPVQSGNPQNPDNSGAQFAISDQCALTQVPPWFGKGIPTYLIAAVTAEKTSAGCTITISQNTYTDAVTPGCCSPPGIGDKTCTGPWGITNNGTPWPPQ